MSEAATREAIEGRVELRGSSLAYRQWGSVDETPVLALHGWLDNAASFDALAPLLHGYRVIAVDLPGHGLSSHRGADGSYNIWDDLPDLFGLTRELGLERYALIGHSRGAVIATLLAAIEAPAVSSLVLLDGMMPPPFDPADTVKQLARYAHDYGRRTSGAMKVFATVEAAVDARCKATGIERVAASMLVARSLEQVDGGYCWRTDGRLRYASALKLDRAQVQTVLCGLQLPSLLVAASAGVLARRMDDYEPLQWFKGLEIERVEGCHHCHMLAQAGPIAARILKFWNDHEPG